MSRTRHNRRPTEDQRRRHHQCWICLIDSRCRTCEQRVCQCRVKDRGYVYTPRKTDED